MADVVLDANVLVGLLHSEDAHHAGARALVARLRSGDTDEAQVRFVADQAEPLVHDVLDVIAETEGRLNVNDALLVILQREGVISTAASFDPDFAQVNRFALIS